MKTEKFSRGAFCFTRSRGLQPRDPAELHPLAALHNLPNIVPEYAGDRTAITRAITKTQSGLQKEGFLLRPITRTASQVVYGIVKEDRDETEQKLDHDFEATVSWTAEPDPSKVNGDHPIACRVADAYQELQGTITSDDWSSTITAYLESHDSARVRGDGRVYWVPPQRIEAVRRLSAFLSEVGLDMVLCELEPEVHTVVQGVAQESITDQLEQLQAEVEKFDGTQRPSTYSRRLKEYQSLRERAGLYRDALGIGVDQAEQVLSELAIKVSTMLDLRKQVIVHRDGSTGSKSTTADPPQEPTALTFAGAIFTLAETMDNIMTFVSDDEYAKASAKALESMGIAGRWQQAGPAQVSIKNSGPPGASVTIKIRLPEIYRLEKIASALNSLGIELTN